MGNLEVLCEAYFHWGDFIDVCVTWNWMLAAEVELNLKNSLDPETKTYNGMIKGPERERKLTIVESTLNGFFFMVADG